MSESNSDFDSFGDFDLGSSSLRDIAAGKEPQNPAPKIMQAKTESKKPQMTSEEEQAEIDRLMKEFHEIMAEVEDIRRAKREGRWKGAEADIELGSCTFEKQD